MLELKFSIKDKIMSEHTVKTLGNVFSSFLEKQSFVLFGVSALAIYWRDRRGTSAAVKDARATSAEIQATDLIVSSRCGRV